MTDFEEELRRLRGKPRLKLFQPTEMRDTGGETRRAHLLDLSATGALVHASDPPAAGGGVQLLLDGAFRAGEVMWADGRRFGLRFRAPLADAQVDGILSARAALVAEASLRIGTLG